MVGVRARGVRARRVKVWGTGRKDWSNNIEMIVVPITRSHQYRSFSHAVYDLTPYSFLTIDTEEIYETIGLLPPTSDWIKNKVNYYMFYSNVTFNANVLIKAYFGLYNFNTGELIRKQTKYGYGKVQFNFPKGFVLTYEEMLQGWTTVLEFLPGGYVIRHTQAGMVDKLAVSG